MFQWTTTRIVNSLMDLTSNKPLITVNAAKGLMHIKRSMVLDKNYIEKVRVARAKSPLMFQMQINLGTLSYTASGSTTAGSGILQDLVDEQAENATLSFYIGLEGSEQSVFANDWYKKGRPFSVGFDVPTSTFTSSTAAANAVEAVVDQIISNINTYRLHTLDGRLFNVSKTGTSTLVITGNDEHQRFMNSSIVYDSGLYVKTIRHYEDGKTTSGYTCSERGRNGFGTYYQLTKDLRLPTAQHTKAYKTLEDELPIPGATYDQYIITYCAPSMANPAFTVLGQKENSETTHIFWVNSTCSADFLNYLIATTYVSTSSGSGFNATSFTGNNLSGLNLNASNAHKVVMNFISPNGHSSGDDAIDATVSGPTGTYTDVAGHTVYDGTDSVLGTDDDTEA